MLPLASVVAPTARSPVSTHTAVMLPRIPPAWIAIATCGLVAELALIPPAVVGAPRPAVLWVTIAVQAGISVALAWLAWLPCGTACSRRAAHGAGLAGLVGSAAALLGVAVLDASTQSSQLCLGLVAVGCLGNVLAAVHGFMFWTLLVNGSLSKGHLESRRAQWARWQSAAGQADPLLAAADLPEGTQAPARELPSPGISEVSGRQIAAPVGRQLPPWAAWAWGSTATTELDSEESRRIVVRRPLADTPHDAPALAPSVTSGHEGPPGVSGYDGDASAPPPRHGVFAGRSMYRPASSDVDGSRWSEPGQAAEEPPPGVRLRPWPAVSRGEEPGHIDAGGRAGGGSRGPMALALALARSPHTSMPAQAPDDEWRVASVADVSASGLGARVHSESREGGVSGFSAAP